MTLYFLHKEQEMRVKILNQEIGKVIVYTGRNNKMVGNTEWFEDKESAYFSFL